AMACGTPVVCSNTSSLPEVAGGHGGTPVRALAAAMERALTDEGLRAEMRARGLERARRFTWEKAAEKTLRGFPGCGSIQS
ncbi:MAG: glycosyltransferase, partial [Anaerolineae bacterium]